MILSSNELQPNYAEMKGEDKGLVNPRDTGNQRVSEVAELPELTDLGWSGTHFAENLLFSLVLEGVHAGLFAGQRGS